ncbi:MAG: peptidoglycan-binding protein, partial [bacterium]|nr:peptidoglycan-binding protein [bacterium]
QTSFADQITQLMAQIQQLQAQLNVLKGTSTAIPKIPAEAPSSTESINSASFYNFTQNLTVGSQGTDVAALQQMLIDGGYLKISTPTAYFGPMTKTALAAWQKANSISPASGYFGPITQAKVAELAAETDNSAVNNEQTPATFIKTYHLWDKTVGLGVLPLKNGGYLLTGDIISGAGVYYPFIIKTDPKGNVLWSKRSGSSSNVYSISSSRHIVRIAVETTDGNIVMVSDTLDFIDAEYEKVREAYGDVLITKLNSNGIKLWSRMLGDYSTDQPQKLWALPDGGVMLLARFMQTGYGNDVADTSALPKHSVLVKIDKNGQVQMSKKMDWNAIDIVLLA